MRVFIKKPLQEGNIWQKLTRQRLAENFVIALNNLLAEKPLLDIKLSEVNRLCRRYKVNVSQYSRRLAGFYHSYLQYCLEDRHLSKREVKELSHLKQLLGLSDRTVRQVHKALTTAIYGQELEKMMNDRKIDSEEFTFLKKLRREICLSDDLAQRILEEKAGKRLRYKLKDIMSDKRITPEEEKDFMELTHNLGFKPDMDEKTQANFERYKLYWQLENDELPRIEAGIHLQDNEQCHYLSDAKWYETEKDTQQIQPTELEGRVRVPRGVYWRTDDEALAEIDSSSWKQIDSGELLLTRSRLIFMGKMGRMVIYLDNIRGLIPYNDGALLLRSKGKSPLLELTEDDADIFCLTLNRLISERE